MTTISIISLLSIAVFSGVLITSALQDFVHFRISNSLVLIGFGAYLPFAALTLSLSSVGYALLVAAGVLAAGFFLYAKGWMGGGDVKLLTVAALWAGPAHAVELLAWTSIFGGLLAVLFMPGFRMGLSYAFNRIGCEGIGRTLNSRELPYGVAIAPGGIIILLQLASQVG